MVVKAADVWNWDSPKKTARCNYLGEQMSRGGDEVLFKTCVAMKFVDDDDDDDDCLGSH